jgi:hypothetical protein
MCGCFSGIDDADAVLMFDVGRDEYTPLGGQSERQPTLLADGMVRIGKGVSQLVTEDGSSFLENDAVLPGVIGGLAGVQS